MANIFVNTAWGAIKPTLRDWLTKRALVLPAAKKAELAKKYGVSVETVEGINQELIGQAAGQLEQFKP